MKSILIAIDGSPAAQEAVAVGLELARDEGAAVTLFHAVSPDERPETRIPSAHLLYTRPFPEPGDVLAEAAASAQAMGVPYTRLVVQGYAVPEILAAAESTSADMIVVGSRGFGALTGTVLGSVSQAVLKRSLLPVLVVRAHGVREHSAELVPA